MKRLIEENKNTAKEYNDIFFQRIAKGVDDFDYKRWGKLIKQFRGGSVLDIGCLDSQIYPMIKYQAPWMRFHYTGIDIADEAIKAMQAKYPDAIFQVMDLYDMKYADNTFDYVVMGEVLEHLEEPQKAIKEAVRVLKKGGTLAVSVPLDEAKEVGAVDHIHHIFSYTVKDIVELLSPYGKVKIGTIGSQYFPVYKYHWPNIIAHTKKK